MKYQTAESEYLERSLEYLAQFERGEFKPFLENLAGDYRGKVPKELFAQQWNAILQACLLYTSKGEKKARQIYIGQNYVDPEHACTLVRAFRMWRWE